MIDKYLILKQSQCVTLVKTSNTFGMEVRKINEDGTETTEIIEIIPSKVQEDKTELEGRLANINELLNDLNQL